MVVQTRTNAHKHTYVVNQLSLFYILNTILGSTAMALCFQSIVNELLELPDKEVEKIAEFYFSILQST